MFGSRATTKSRAGYWRRADDKSCESRVSSPPPNPKPETQDSKPRFARLKLAAENTPLAARLFDADFQGANFRAVKFLPHPTADSVGDILR